MKYDLTSPLFSDYAIKYREEFVPEGLQASYRATDTFEFPIGTIIAKTFAIRADFQDPNSAEEMIETRLLIHRDDGWVGLPYIWNDDKSAAELTVVGGTQAVSWIDANGDAQSTNYEIPNSNQCKNCHGQQEAKPIGPKARFLDKLFDYAGSSENQLERWTAAGMLAGVPDVSAIDTVPDFLDASADLNDRAQGYLDINCAHCHNPDGAADTTGLFLEAWRDVNAEYGLCKPPVAAGRAAGNLDFDILPGNATDSIMVFRMNSNEADVQMPELSRSLIHREGVQLISDWINAMTPADFP